MSRVGIIPERVAQRDFARFVEGPVAILLVKRGSVLPLSDDDCKAAVEVGRYLEPDHPGVRVGWFDRHSLITQTWLVRQLRREPLESDWPSPDDDDNVPDGFYLFRNGQPHSFHTGRADISGQPPLLALIQAAGRSAKSTAKLVAEHFDMTLAASVKRRPPKKASGSVVTTSDPVPTLEQSYAKLGIAETASDAEVKAAKAQALHENFPDKVNTMSAAIKRTAEQETRAVITAYETIMAARGRGKPK